MSDDSFDFVRMGATGRQLQEIVLGRMAERDAEVAHRETEAIMLLCAELASIAHAPGPRTAQWSAIAFLAMKMKEAAK